MKTYVVPANFSGRKFALRYNLDSMKDFWIVGDLLYVPDNLPDDPPMFEVNDAIVPIPPSLKVHHWSEMVGWLSGVKLLANENNGIHHECYYIIADDEAALSDPFMSTLNIQIGQPGYIKDKHELRVWTGVAWKKP